MPEENNTEQNDPGEKSITNDIDWELLLGRIKIGKCTPFIGAGASSDIIPLGSAIAKEWALEHKFPLPNFADDLVRVAQFVALRKDPQFPKERIVERFAGIKSPVYTMSGQPHGVLAELPLPIYITTNYDDFMYEALKSRNKQPKRVLCRWNRELQGYIPSEMQKEFESKKNFQATVANPVVFHLHGHQKLASSLVLTEDDYLDFLVNLSHDREDILPPRIQEALAGTSLLFMGYALADWDFRVIFRGLATATEGRQRRMSVAVQLLPVSDETPTEQRQNVQGYLDKYFGAFDMKVYWGRADQFAKELQKRWTAYPK